MTINSQSLTSQAIRIMMLDTSTTIVAVKARAAAASVGLKSWRCLALAYRNLIKTAGHRCDSCGQLIVNKGD